MNADGANPVQITQTGGVPCGVTPDGKWLYYSSVRRTLFKISVDGGDEIPVNEKSRVNRPVCSPDGNFVAYFFLDKGFKIGVVKTEDGSVAKILDYGDGKSLALRLAWSPDSRTLNFVTDTDGNNILWQQSLDEETPRKIADLGAETIRDLVIMPDSRGYAVIGGKHIHNAVLVEALK
jgi:Tol biopolymer transport system component